MTIHRFITLSTVQQCYYTSRLGVYLSTRQEINHSIDLYQGPNFYVEVYYEKGSLQCACVKAFSSVNFLDEYLEEIDIEALFC